ncbi:MAG: DsrE family protein [Glaciecola sp.]|nr:DsrE family protein [Glaciecola sp.]MDG1816419.1 DsrE family protein [Glaciecola sp.]MDG2098466.1 DsrE family protein [Glaciecola sp.]
MKNITAILSILCTCMMFMLSASTNAQTVEFKDGPVIMGFGKNAPVSTHTVPNDTVFKVAFDVGSTSDNKDEVNRKFNSLARFINMHVAAGVKKENIQLALVVHGKATLDLLDHTHYKQKFAYDNPNKPLLLALMANNVRVILCGQSAVAYNVEASQIVAGAEVELSAMTAHALLQQQGYTINPF